VPVPTATVDDAAVLDWHVTARAQVDAAVGLALTHPAARLEPHELPALVADVDAGAQAAERVRQGATVTVQRVHGDLHVGRVLRWTGGLSVVGFDAEPEVLDGPGPVAAGDGGELAPAARDLARLLGSLREVARVAAARPGMPPGAPEAWYGKAREQVLAAYRSVLAGEGLLALLDDDLLRMFEAQERALTALRTAAGHPAPIS
jgi:maltokinase